MPITSNLSRRLAETLGDEASAEMVNWMHQQEAHRVELRELNDLNFARFDTRLTALAERVDARIDALSERVDARIEGLSERVDGQIQAHAAHMEQRLTEVEAALRIEINRQRGDLMRTMFLFWAGTVIPLAALMIALVKF